MIPPDLPPAPALVATLAAAVLAGLARGFSGFGSAMIFIPLASLALGPRVAAPLLLLVDNLTAFPLIPGAWRRADRREVAVMALGASLGTPLGAWLLLRADPVTLRWGVCGLVAVLLALLASGWRYRGRPAALLSVSVGACAGLFSGAAQMGGPPVVAYWLGGAIEAGKVRANIVLFFAATASISTAVYLVGGLLTAEVLWLTLLAAPGYGAGLWCGSRCFGRASERTFRHLCFAVIALSALVGLPLWG